jgi:hypothetical protein
MVAVVGATTGRRNRGRGRLWRRGNRKAGEARRGADNVRHWLRLCVDGRKNDQ